jgi:hypothetical protein
MTMPNNVKYHTIPFNPKTLYWNQFHCSAPDPEFGVTGFVSPGPGT